MRRHLIPVVAVGMLAAVLVALSPPFSGTTEAPARAGVSGRAGASATPAPGGPDPAGARFGRATGSPAAASGVDPQPSGAAASDRALGDAGAPGVRESTSLAAAVRDTISSASEALHAATSDDRVMYAAALRARDAGAYAYAIDAFRSVVQRGGPLAPVADLRMAQAMVSAGRRPEAAAAFADSLARADLPPELVTAARLDAASNAEKLGQTDAALTYLHAIRDDAGASSYDRSTAAWRAAQIRRDAGDSGWVDDAAAAVTLQPASAAAPDALDALDAPDAGGGGARAAVPPLTAAYVRYRAYQNDQATKRYRAITQDSANSHDSAIAFFYLGALDERAGDKQAALDDYGRSLTADPTGPLADDARYWRGRVYQESDDVTAAVAQYDLLASDFPQSPFTPDARMRAALLLALHGDATSALARLSTIAEQAGPSGGATAAAAARWSEVFRRLYGLPPDPAFRPASYDPVALPALLDAAGTTSLPPTAVTETPVPPTDAASIDAWLATTFGPPGNFSSEPSVSTDPGFTLGTLLVGVGETSVGTALLRNTIDTYRANPYALLEIARAARDLDVPAVEVSAARAIFSPLSTIQKLGAPKSILALSYPTPYLSDTSKYASEYGIPTLLLTALVRQESAFDPTAGSVAGAVGLTQVTPGTGEQIARALGVPWTPSMLEDPATSLRFGAYYLSTQLDTFNGNVFAALAAYNGGPGNAARWMSDAPFPGADGFLLSVDYSETDTYLSTVLENYAWYRYIYQEAPSPSLR